MEEGEGGVEHSAVAARWLAKPDRGVTLRGICRWKLTRSENRFMSSHPWMALAQAHMFTDTHTHTHTGNTQMLHK